MFSLTNLLLASLSASTFFVASAYAESSEQQVIIYSWPLASSAPQELAKIEYNSAAGSSVVSKFTPPTASSGSSRSSPDDLVRVGLFDPKTADWRGVLTAADSFNSEFQQKIELHVDDKSQVWHVGFTARPKPKVLAAKPARKGNQPLEVPQVVVEIVRPTPGPTPHLNKPVVLSPDGKVQGKEEEKTFLQKYWWAIGLFVLLQVVMSGGGAGGDK